MKKSFMTRVLAVTLSTAMAFSVSSASNLMTASAASKPYVALKTKFKTLTVGQKYKMTLKNNSVKWRIQSATSSDKTIVKPFKVKPTYVKLKGKAEGKVKITYKLKTNQRKTNNTKTLKGTVRVKAKGGTDTPSTTFSATATASDTANVKITFSQAIDTEGVTEENFAINNDVTVREAKVSEDGKTVDLVIAGATYATDYEVTVSGVKVAGEAKDSITCKFTTPAAAAGYQTKLDGPTKPLKSDGQTTAVFKFELKDKTGELVTDDGVEVLFETTLGNFAEPRAILDKGVAENTFTTQSLQSTRTAVITATVIAADNKDLIGQSAIANVILTPNPEQLTDTSIGAIITNAVAPTADRVVAYFQKEVHAEDFQKSNGALDESKFTASVKSGIDSSYGGGTTHRVVGVLDVDDEPNALQLLVDTPMTDNTTISVTFQDKQNTESVISSSNTVYCKLTDGYQPSALKVTVLDNHTLEVEFSEAVMRLAQADAYAPGNRGYAADLASNYAIDTKKITDAWNVNDVGTGTDQNTDDSNTDDIISSKDHSEGNEVTNGKVTVGVYRNGVDKRNIVTIDLGVYLPAGNHSLAISNVGDWAALTDGWRNIINTATVDFVVPEDSQRPSFTYEVQSPEQYKLTANCNFSLADPNKTFKTGNSGNITNDIVQLQELRSTGWTTISDNAEDVIGNGYNPIMVSQVKDEQTGRRTKEFIVETTRDWTRVLNTKSTNNHYYRNTYRLYIASGALINRANGLPNEEIIIPLSDDPIMKSLDGNSPVIDKIEQAVDKNGDLTSNYHVTFSEPVKLSDGSGDLKGANEEGMTPTQEVEDKTLYSAYFVKKDNTQKTVQAKVNIENFINAEDTMIRVEPEGTLDAGEWDLTVRGAVDDLGNTAATLTQTIVVEAKTVETPFKVVWAAVAENESYNSITPDNGYYIFVKFNKPISVYGGSANVGATFNYTLNGQPLPSGTEISAHIKDYDDHVSDRVDSITIKLPRAGSGLGASTIDYAVNGQNTILTISSAVTSADGDALSTVAGYDMPYQYGEAGVGGFNKLTVEGDAVWGNAADERYSGITGNMTYATNAQKYKAYVDALKSALANDKYRKVMLDANITDSLDIKRLVDLDLKGWTVNGNISISSDEAAQVLKIANGAIIGEEDNTEQEAALTINTPNVDVEVAKTVTIQAGNNKSKSVIINGVRSDTFKTEAKIHGDIVLAGSSMGFENLDEGSIDGKIQINTTGTVKLKGKYTTDLNVTMLKAAKLILTELDIDSSNSLTIKAQAPNAEITVKSDTKTMNSASKITVVAEKEGVVVKRHPDATITLKVNGGSFVQKNESGDRELTGANVLPTTATGAQEWFDTLTVIDGATNGDTGVEVVTVSAVSGAATAAFNGGNIISKYITDQAADKPAGEDGYRYVVNSVVPTISSNYIGWDSANKKVYVKAAANNIPYTMTEEFTVAITVKNTTTDEVQTLSRKVQVVIEKQS